LLKKFIKSSNNKNKISISITKTLKKMLDMREKLQNNEVKIMNQKNLNQKLSLENSQL